MQFGRGGAFTGDRLLELRVCVPCAAPQLEAAALSIAPAGPVSARPPQPQGSRQAEGPTNEQDVSLFPQEITVPWLGFVGNGRSRWTGSPSIQLDKRCEEASPGAGSTEKEITVPT